MSHGSTLTPRQKHVLISSLHAPYTKLRREGFAVRSVYASPTYPPDIYGDERFVKEALRAFDANLAHDYAVIGISHDTLLRIRKLYLVGSVDHPPSHAYNSAMEIVIFPAGPHWLVFRRTYFQPSQERERTGYVYGTDKPIPAALLAPNAVIPPDVLADPARLQAWAASQWTKWRNNIGKGHAKPGTLTGGPVLPGLTS